MNAKMLDHTRSLDICFISTFVGSCNPWKQNIKLPIVSQVNLSSCIINPWLHSNSMHVGSMQANFDTKTHLSKGSSFQLFLKMLW